MYEVLLELVVIRPDRVVNGVVNLKRWRKKLSKAGACGRYPAVVHGVWGDMQTHRTRQSVRDTGLQVEFEGHTCSNTFRYLLDLKLNVYIKVVTRFISTLSYRFLY